MDMIFHGQLSNAFDLFRTISERYYDHYFPYSVLGVLSSTMLDERISFKFFEAALDINRDDWLSSRHLGGWYFEKARREGDEEVLRKALYYFQRSEEIRKDEGDVLFKWRRFLDASEYDFIYFFGTAYLRLGERNEAYSVFEEGVRKGFWKYASQRSRHMDFSILSKPWWDPYELQYDLANVLEDNFNVIDEELLALVNFKWKPENEGLHHQNTWDQFILYENGKKKGDHCLKCPATCSIIDSFPHIANFNQVKFSRMKPGTKVYPHCGSRNNRLRMHLGLQIPDDVHIRVNTETKQWTKGKCILFDDSYEHEVWHNGSIDRIILIIDIPHPNIYTPKTDL